jgi:hypothetical protein
VKPFSTLAALRKVAVATSHKGAISLGKTFINETG